MKKFSVLLSAMLFLSIAVFGQTLTQADRDKGTQYLEQTRDGVVAATKGLSEAQMKFKPAPDRWSVAETLEHITLGEDLMFQSVTDKIMKAPAGPADRGRVGRASAPAIRAAALGLRAVAVELCDQRARGAAGAQRWVQRRAPPGADPLPAVYGP